MALLAGYVVARARGSGGKGQPSNTSHAAPSRSHRAVRDPAATAGIAFTDSAVRIARNGCRKITGYESSNIVIGLPGKSIQINTSVAVSQDAINAQ